MKKESPALDVVQPWGSPVEPSLRMKEMNLLFKRISYRQPPSDKIELGEGYVQVLIDIRSDVDRFGVPEFGTYRFYFNENRVEKL